MCAHSHCHLSSLAFRFKVVIPCLLFGLARLTNTPLPLLFFEGPLLSGSAISDVTLVKVVHWWLVDSKAEEYIFFFEMVLSFLRVLFWHDMYLSLLSARQI